MPMSRSIGPLPLLLLLLGLLEKAPGKLVINAEKAGKAIPLFSQAIISRGAPLMLSGVLGVREGSPEDSRGVELEAQAALNQIESTLQVSLLE